MFRQLSSGPARRRARAVRVAAATFGVAALSAGVATQGQTLYWDVNGANAGASDGTTASGSFNGANWTTDPTGSSPTITFASTSPPRPVVFSAGANATGASTINVDTSVSIGAFTVEEGSIKFTGSGGVNASTNPGLLKPGCVLDLQGTLPDSYGPLTGTGPLTIDGGTLRGYWNGSAIITANNATLDGEVSVAKPITLANGVTNATLTKTGAGNCYVPGPSAVTTLNVNGGVYVAYTDASFGAPTGTVNVGNGASVQFGVSSGLSDLTSPATRSFVLTGDATFRSASAGWQLNSPIGGAGSFCLGASSPGASALITLGGTNTWGGATKLLNGDLYVTGGNAIPDTSAVVFTPQAFTRLHVVDDETIGSLASEGGDGSLGSIEFDLGKTLTVGTDNTSTTYLGGSSGGGNLTKVGAGTLRFGGFRTWNSSRFSVKQGTVEVERGFWSASRLFVGDGSDTPAALKMTTALATPNSGQLAVDGSAAVLDLGRTSWSSSGSPIVLDHGGSITGASDRLITLTARVFDFRSGSVDATLNQYISPPGSVLNKTTTGTVTLKRANRHTGGTNVVAGKLVAGNGDAFGVGALSVSDQALAYAQPDLAKAMTFTTIATAGSGALDLTNNAAVIRAMTPEQVRALIVSGFNGGQWNGGGINSSTAAAAAGDSATAIGYASNADLQKTSFKGVDGLTSTDVLVSYTYAGDSDLSGATTLDDFTLFLGGFRHDGSTWFEGDYDYDDAVTLDDFSLFLAGYRQQGTPLSALESMISTAPVSDAERAAMLAAVNAVPEPAVLGLSGLTGLALVRRRVKRGGP